MDQLHLAGAGLEGLRASLYEDTGDAYYKNVAESPLVYPTPADEEKLYVYRVLTEDEQLEWNGIFQPIYQS